MPFNIDDIAESSTPADLVRSYYPLQGSVDPLIELVKTNGVSVLRSVVELAMALGIQAARHKYRLDDVDKRNAEARESVHDLIDRSTYTFWRGQDW